MSSSPFAMDDDDDGAGAGAAGRAAIASGRSRRGGAGGGGGPDLVRDGPCADPLALLRRCQEQQQQQQPGLPTVSPSSSSSSTGAVLTHCVSETDLLIRCVRRNPAQYHAAGMRK